MERRGVYCDIHEPGLENEVWLEARYWCRMRFRLTADTRIRKQAVLDG